MPMPTRKLPLLVLLLLLVASGLTGASGPSGTGGAESPGALAEAIAAALNTRDAAALDALVAGERPEWMTAVLQGPGGGRGPEQTWEGAVVTASPGMRLPSAPLVALSTYHPVESDDDHLHRATRVGDRWRLGPEWTAAEMARSFRILDHRLEVRLRPEAHAMAVTDRLTAERLPGAGRLMLVALSRDFRVHAVRHRDEPVPFSRAGGFLAVALPRSVGTGRFTLQLEYEGVVRHPGWDNIDPEGTFIFSYWYPHIARLPATAEVAITAPAGLTVVGQGELTGRVRNDQQERWVWRQDHPVCWVMFAAGTWHVTERKVGDKTYGVYLLREDRAKAERTLEVLERAMAFFSRRFGPFPWSHYEVVEYPLDAGGLESYTFTICSPRAVPGVVAHEVAHSWWGGIVPNTYTQDMWNEAFATYSERLLDEEEGRRRGRGRPRSPSGRAYGELPISKARNALDGAHAAVGYQKGAAVLHAARRAVGDALFFQSLQQFVKRFRGRPATWRDYAGVVEELAGAKMRPFFDQWLDRPGVPRLAWGGVSVTKPEAGRFRLEVELRQAEPPFQIDLPVTIETQDGERLRRTVAMRGATAVLALDLTAAPSRILLDPDRDLPLALDRPDRDGDPWVYELPAAVGKEPQPRGVAWTFWPREALRFAFDHGL